MSVIDMSENIRKDLIEKLPSSIVNEVACFTFYEKHPRDLRKVDITICTDKGEMYEFHDRNVVSKIFIDNFKSPKELILVRRETTNEKCKVFYVLVLECEIVILFIENNDFKIQHRVNNIERYEFVDTECIGNPYLKVVCIEDALPIIFDNNFDVCQPLHLPKNESSVDTIPSMTEVLLKLTEAKYNVNKNKGILDEYVSLKQAVAFSLYEEITPNANDTLFKCENTEIGKILRVKSESPILKISNKKSLIITCVRNEDNVPFENLQLLFHGTSKPSYSYTTKIFQKVISPPYWEEKMFSDIIQKYDVYIVAIVDLKEIKYNISSRIELEPLLSYKKLGESYILPLGNVTITPLKYMGNDFDVILDTEEEDELKMLTVLASTERIDLKVNHIKEKSAKNINVYNEICKLEQFKSLTRADNILIHNQSPYHLLYGLTIIFCEGTCDDRLKLQVYYRSTDQILAFVQLLYDAIPYRLMVTLPDFKIASKQNELSHYNTDGKENMQSLNYLRHAKSIMKQTMILQEYLTKCMNNMVVNMDEDVKEDIPLLSPGLPEFMNLRNVLLNISEEPDTSDLMSVKSEDMIVDDD